MSNNPLPYQFQQIHVQNGRPDILFHWHPELEIHYVHEGTARYHIDYDYFNSQTGDIILIRPNGMHSIHPLAQKEHLTAVFNCHLDMLGASMIDLVSLRYLQPLQNSQYKLTPCIKPDMSGYQDIKTCLFMIFQLVEKKERHFEILLKSKLQELIYYLFYYRYVVRKQSNDIYRKNEKIRELIDYINHHYHTPLSIDTLAQQMGYSKTHFMALFKEHTGTTCTDFIIQVRLNKACERLIDTTDSILDIAQQVGFNNLSNFNRQFKAYHQVTPSQYRKNQLIKNS
ncbi:AraC family transcriptional regulator [Streptococcus sp. sy010]|uniref:AraC family transcriptional regulator n=1 Tax=Streptococcus sp. sy010 TaxID=2600148 RepID=UPI0011B38581|nr:AraC family transcriptional regulator [Streptococcus sp. sy010]TWT16742.1 AraC family transcriptional regulator [Streptococcus sp. sy010]